MIPVVFVISLSSPTFESCPPRRLPLPTRHRAVHGLCGKCGEVRHVQIAGMLCGQTLQDTDGTTSMLSDLGDCADEAIRRRPNRND